MGRSLVSIQKRKVYGRSEQRRITMRRWRTTDSGKRSTRETEWRAQGLTGATATSYKELESQQGGRCAICGKTPSRRSLHWDHNHATGAPRGLLCARCNFAISTFEMAGWPQKAQAYLELY